MEIDLSPMENKLYKPHYRKEILLQNEAQGQIHSLKHIWTFSGKHNKHAGISERRQQPTFDEADRSKPESSKKTKTTHGNKLSSGGL